jgi:hypothetical protein
MPIASVLGYMRRQNKLQDERKNYEGDGRNADVGEL